MTPPPASDSGQPLRVVLLEDDDELRQKVLMPGLRDYGFDVAGVGDASALDRLLGEHVVDIVVLDVGLPDEDGFSVARRLRRHSTLGIVMLTGRDASADRIRGLDGGADAYLAKPVALDELAATLRSLARRLGAGSPPETRGDGGWQLDFHSWSLRAPSGRSVALTQPERLVLAQLMREPGTPVSREALIAALTEQTHDFDPHRLEMLVHRLRGKIADAGGEALPLRAVRGAGYVMLP